MFNFAGTDTKSKGSKSSMCRSMTVSADDRGPRKSEALLWTYNVDDTLASVPQAKVGETKGLDVIFQGEALDARVGLLDELFHVLEVFAGCGGNILQAVTIPIAKLSPTFLHGQ